MTISEPGPDLSSDVYARLLKDRIVVLGEAIDDAVVSLITAQLLHLESEDPEKDIALHINSPGGPSASLLAIYDTMQHVRPDVSTVCVGQAGSAAAVLLAAGAHGKRFALPHSRIMLRHTHEEIGGDAASIEIHARHTGQAIEKVSADTERDVFLSPQEAMAYGIVDEVLADRPR